MNKLQYRGLENPGALYQLLANQVKCYHKHYHMGENSSVPVEVAQELLASICYTLELAGQGGSADARLRRGQTVLAGHLEEAQQLYRLVTATQWGQGSWFWEDMAQIGNYLARYDHLHFAHRSPELLCYPTALPIPQGMQGIDAALFYLNCLWVENQILFQFPEEVLAEFWTALPWDFWQGPEILCQRPLLNAAGRVLLGLPLESLLLDEEEKTALLPQLSRENVTVAAERVFAALSLTADVACYARAAIAEVLPRLLAAKEPERLFL